MYVLIAKILFTAEPQASERREAHFYRQLAAKLRTQQRLCASIYREEGQVVLALTALASHPDRLRTLCEQASALCEREGLGRVIAAGKPLIAHIDRLC